MGVSFRSAVAIPGALLSVSAFRGLCSEEWQAAFLDAGTRWAVRRILVGKKGAQSSGVGARQSRKPTMGTKYVVGRNPYAMCENLLL